MEKGWNEPIFDKSFDMTLVEKSTVDGVVADKISSLAEQNIEDAFYIVDIGDIAAKYNKWREVFPRIEPFYAVKCNDSIQVIKLLANLGTGFDCASKVEIEKALMAGASPERIIYANPCKQTNFLRYSKQVAVDMMTFDNKEELMKIKEHFPQAKLVLRILPPSTDKVQCVLGNKFGCPPKEARQLLNEAQSLCLNVVGVSFHVGSGCYDAHTFALAVKAARDVFDIGVELGFQFDLLDVGGGFPGTPDAKITIEQIGEAMNEAIEECFPESSGVRLIAEPGRFFVASAFTLVLNVIGKRVVPRDVPKIASGEPVGDGHVGKMTGNDEPHYMYFVNDGVYGSFNCMLYDHAEITVQHMPATSRAHRDLGPNEYSQLMQYSSSVWGPTCDGLDLIKEHCMLPELNVGDWLTFPNMGAYTLAAGSPFNGMPPPKVYFVAKLSRGSVDKAPIYRKVGDKMAPRACELYEALHKCQPVPSASYEVLEDKET